MNSVELARARADMEAQLLYDSALIERRTATINDDGTESLSWATVATVAARVEPMSNRDTDGVLGERADATQYYRGYVPAGTDIDAGDRVTIDGNVLYVTQVFAVRTYGMLLRVMLSEVA